MRVEGASAARRVLEHRLNDTYRKHLLNSSTPNMYDKWRELVDSMSLTSASKTIWRRCSSSFTLYDPPHFALNSFQVKISDVTDTTQD